MEENKKNDLVSCEYIELNGPTIVKDPKSISITYEYAHGDITPGIYRVLLRGEYDEKLKKSRLSHLMLINDVYDYEEYFDKDTVITEKLAKCDSQNPIVKSISGFICIGNQDSYEKNKDDMLEYMMEPEVTKPYRVSVSKDLLIVGFMDKCDTVKNCFIYSDSNDESFSKPFAILIEFKEGETIKEK